MHAAYIYIYNITKQSSWKQSPLQPVQIFHSFSIFLIRVNEEKSVFFSLFYRFFIHLFTKFIFYFHHHSFCCWNIYIYIQDAFNSAKKWNKKRAKERKALLLLFFFFDGSGGVGASILYLINCILLFKFKLIIEIVPLLIFLLATLFSFNKNRINKKKRVEKTNRV